MATIRLPKDPERLRKKFKKLRTDAGLTQTEVAALLEYANGNVVYMKESGRRNLYRRDVLALMKVVEE